MNFSKILVSWGKFEKALWSDRKERERNGGALGASLKGQEVDLGIHIAGQRGDGCVDRLGVGGGSEVLVGELGFCCS